ncbi:hypothetical protein DMC47_14740 [Nostoc sp. 3335mG]|jgi:hypothetical protein|nr:hypothetical protein DMC47_14740 [Nostoc sp. 3335mG]
MRLALLPVVAAALTLAQAAPSLAADAPGLMMTTCLGERIPLPGQDPPTRRSPCPDACHALCDRKLRQRRTG